MQYRDLNATVRALVPLIIVSLTVLLRVSLSNCCFGHIAAEVGCCATRDGWKRDVGERAVGRLVTGWRVLEPARRMVAEG